ncbi:MAG: hypothetical protein ACFFDB_00745 [Promethearchaeota archaeon]
MSKKDKVDDTILHPVMIGHCASFIRGIMEEKDIDFDSAFKIFKTKEIRKNRILSKLTEAEIRSNKLYIQKRIVEEDSKEENLTQGLNWWAIGRVANQITEIMTREKKEFSDVFQMYRSNLFKDTFKKYSFEDLEHSKIIIEERVKEILPAGFSLEDSIDIQYSKGGKKRFTEIEDIESIDLTDVHLVLKSLKNILSVKYGEKEKKIRIGQMDKKTSMKRLPKHSYSMILSFVDLENRDKFLLSEEFRLLSGALLAAASKYNNKESLSVLIP